MKKALIIDGNSMFYRFYYATFKQNEFAIKRNLISNNGIKLMLNLFTKLISENNYDYFLIAFDYGSKTFRHDQLSSYKSGRQQTPQDLINQMHATQTLLKALGYCVDSKNQIEADDLIGSAVNFFSKENIFSEVYSSDKDLLQLVSNTCNVNLMRTGLSNLETYTINNFQEKFYGLIPKEIIEYKGIVGDTSDKLKGIPGIGHITGVKLICKYHNIESIINNLDKFSLIIQNKFNNNINSAFKCRQLATILTNQYNGFNLDFFIKKSINYHDLKHISEKYNLKIKNNAKIKQEKLF